MSWIRRDQIDQAVTLQRTRSNETTPRRRMCKNGLREGVCRRGIRLCSLWGFALALAIGICVVRVSATSLEQLGAFTQDSSQRPVVPGVGSGTQDPKKVLRAAEDALRAVRSVSYEATYYGTGAFATRTWTASGKVRVVKLAVGDPLKAKLAAEGQQFRAGNDQPQAFHAVFDGHSIRKLHPADSTVIEKSVDTDPKGRTLGTVTGFFGGGAYSLLMFEYFVDRPFGPQAEAGLVEYEGRAIVAKVLCHVVYVEFPAASDGRVKRERWFIGIKDNLPRQFEAVAVDDKGRYGGYVLTLSNVRANPPVNPLVFTISPPSGFRIKAYEPPSRLPFLAVGDVAPDWKLLDAEGKTHALSDYRGKLVLLDFWATWCGPCLRGMPGLQKLHEKYGNRGMKVIGINTWEESNASGYMKDRGYTYTLLLKGEKVAEAYRATTLPTIYIVGVDGKIIYRSGFAEAEDLAIVINQHLNHEEDELR